MCRAEGGRAGVTGGVNGGVQGKARSTFFIWYAYVYGTVTCLCVRGFSELPARDAFESVGIGVSMPLVCGQPSRYRFYGSKRIPFSPDGGSLFMSIFVLAAFAGVAVHGRSTAARSATGRRPSPCSSMRASQSER